MPQYTDIRGIIFDLDGTLYESPGFAASILESAAGFISTIHHIEINEARRLIAETRQQLSDERDEIPTLSAVCSELGGGIRDLHSYFENHIRPEAYLLPDQRVIDLMTHLHTKLPLYLYTNNNRTLTTRILEQLGLRGLFKEIFSIDDTWTAKPDNIRLGKILADAGLQPSQALFVGDRYDVDLRLPEQLGCPVYLSQTIEQLLRLENLIKT